MKNILSILALSIALTSCGPGKWVAGNAGHFKQRELSKKQKADREKNLSETKNNP